jgi:polysaccharide deacetylase family protein (PEP-CTERM system associated)
MDFPGSPVIVQTREPRPVRSVASPSPLQVILSFDVEEHNRIEAAADLSIDPHLKAHYRTRLDISTHWLLDVLAEADIQATFFIVGQIAEHNAALIRRIAREGHEVALHGWDHRCLHHFTPAAFREDVAHSKQTLEDLTGQAVVGYRAPTFSLMRQTAWAIDVLAELDMSYDSSIYPVRHDRYGVPNAPRSPFVAYGDKRGLLELPPATLRLFGVNLPMGGGGYFRLFPRCCTEWAIRQTERHCWPTVAMLYFHPWEFDPQQQRLPLGYLSGLRTYVGIRSSRRKLATLLARFRFCRAVDVANQLDPVLGSLPTFPVGA